MIEQALPEMCPVMQYGIMYGVWDGRNLAQREEIKAAYEAGAEIRVELTWLREGRRSLRRRFVLFHALNPHIYALFTYYANELLDARAAQGGTPRGSHWQVMQRVRWDSYLQTTGDDPYKVSNDFIALYARMLIHDDPRFENFFTLKSMKPEE